MAGPSWLVDGNRFATKIKCASGTYHPGKISWKSNPSRACPNCQHIIDNSDVTQEWPGLPRGVKFDPSDQEIIWHLLAKAGVGNLKPHPFIDEFIPTLYEDDGICYTHPQNLPGVKQDGSTSHFFHRAIKAYNTGTRKRRKIHGDDSGDVRWHKTGRTKPVIVDGVQKGCKKIMVLYASTRRGDKPEKTNWVMHQYHLGTEEDEKNGEFVISKVFHQQHQVKQNEQDLDDITDVIDDVMAKVDPVTPKSVTPEPPRIDHCGFADARKESTMSNMDIVAEDCDLGSEDDVRQAEPEKSIQAQPEVEIHTNLVVDQDADQGGEDPKWWDSESQYLLDSQQLVEGLSLCDDLLHSQSPNRDGNENDAAVKGKPGLSDYAHLGPEHLKEDLEECQNLVLDPAKPGLSDYAHLGPEHLKEDLEECQNLVLDPANIELDTPPDFRLSQLEFGSQESFLAWGGSKVAE